MSDYNYEYQEQNDPLDEHDQRYNTKSRNETNKNIKLLNEILVAQNSPPTLRNNEESEERPQKRKRKGRKKESNKMFAFSLEMLKDPILMIVIYVILHTNQVNNLLIRYLPKTITNPDKIFIYYGARGAIFTVVYYLISGYLKYAV